jgi:dTDP-4-dehydrorhamnose reductase
VSADPVTYLDLAEVGPSLQALPEIEVAVICGGISQFAECRRDPELARRVNVLGPRKLVEWLENRSARTILLSTSAVFDGKIPQVRAEDTRNPQSLYGKTKVEAEDAVLSSSGGAVLRMTKLVSSNSPLLKGWNDSLAKGLPVRAFHDHSLSPIQSDAVIEAIGAMIELKASGLFQVSGCCDISYYDAATYIGRRLGQPDSLIQARSARESLPDEEVFAYTSLDCRRLEALIGYDSPTPESVIDAIFSS